MTHLTIEEFPTLTPQYVNLRRSILLLLSIKLEKAKVLNFNTTVA